MEKRGAKMEKALYLDVSLADEVLGFGRTKDWSFNKTVVHLVKEGLKHKEEITGDE
jgi:hypothetical protein